MMLYKFGNIINKDINNEIKKYDSKYIDTYINIVKRKKRTLSWKCLKFLNINIVIRYNYKSYFLKIQ